MVLMATKTQRAERRTDALSKERIVEAAIGILDADGESALTFRALTARLATGAGAIYWHVASKDDLLAATTNDVIARVMTEVADDAEPRQAIRAIALGVFDAIDAHPWVGAQLSREPWHSAMLRIFEGIGEQLRGARGSAPGAVRLRVRAAELHPRPGRAVRRGRPRCCRATRTGPRSSRPSPPGGRNSTRPSTRSSAGWRRNCPGTTTASSSWPASTSSWPASEPSDSPREISR